MSDTQHLLSRRTFIGAAAAGTAALATGAASQASAAPSAPPAPASGDMRDIVRVAIHPAVGFARVGNSPDAFYFNTEVPGQASRGPFKDDLGAMAKVAARFRVYGYDRRGRVVAELTAENARISWQVAIANGKAAWYTVNEAFDVPSPPPCGLRNPDVADRESLVVWPGPRRVRGAGASPVPLDGGSFLGTPVPLGEILTDAQGRLVVLPADGDAVQHPGAPPLGGLDNNGWTDDVGDGPVHATVTIRGRTLEATPAWCVISSPDWGPSIAESITTLADIVESALYSAGRRDKPKTDFYRDVWPIFRRIVDLQWVSGGFAISNGWGTPQDWTRPGLRRRLADPSAGNAAFRQAVFASFRDPSFDQVEPDLVPALYGDKIGMPPNQVQPRQWYALTPLQHDHLRAWSRGRFTVTTPAEEPSRLADIPIAQQPEALDRASLGSTLGGAFHPGVEFPWVARVPWVWTRDMRLRVSSDTPDMTDYGEYLTQEIALSRTGPLSRMGPGSISRWMGIPWHVDSASCRSGYQKAISQVSPNFWPARIPNQVLSEADYRIVIDTARSITERRAAFERRRDWERFISAPTRVPIVNAMATEWYRLGIVAEMPGPRDALFPAVLKVESGVGFDREPDFDYGAWYTVAQLPQFPLVAGCSDDNSLRLITAQGDESPLWVNRALARPEGLARDSQANLYVACMDDGTIAKVTPTGVVSTYADGLESPVGLAVGPGGLLYVTNYADDGWIAEVLTDGTVRVVVPKGSGLARPLGIAWHPDGILVVNSTADGTVKTVDPSTGRILDPAWITGLQAPRLMAFDAHQRLLLASRSGPPLLRFDLTGTPVATQLRGARFTACMGVAVDSRDRVYVTDSSRNAIARVTFSGDVGTSELFSYSGPNPGGLVFNGGTP